MAVKRAESRGGERLVYRRDAPKPRIPLGDQTCVRRELRRELTIEETRVSWPAAVVHQSDDRRNASVSHAIHALVGPRPVSIVQIAGRDFLPEERIPQYAEPGVGAEVDVVHSMRVTGELELIVVPVPNAVDGALDAAP